MAMYYYASKISAIACGARCRKNMFKMARGQRDRDKTNLERSTIEIIDDTCKLENEDKSSNCHIARYTTSTYEFSKSNRELINILIPTNNKKFNQDLVFSTLLSTRFFIKPHELLGVLLSEVPELDCMDSVVELLKLWSEMFPYDFRDERIMNHVKHISSKFSDTPLENLISEVLSALLICLTDLENHEKVLRNYITNKSNAILENKHIDRKSSNYAEILYRIEHRLARYIGPEEFAQCSNNILQKQFNSIRDKALSFRDSKKTCNLESYVEWCDELRLFICNDILKHAQLDTRSKVVSFWIEVAQNSLALENYNSTVIILEALESPPIKRLEKTWSKLAITCQQLDYLHHDAEGYVRDYKLNLNNFSLIDSNKIDDSKTEAKVYKRKNNNAVIPYFSDILKLALNSREQCLIMSPEGNVNLTSFTNFSAIVGMFTVHMKSLKSEDIPGEFQQFRQHMQRTSVLKDSELMDASLICESLRKKNV